MNSSVSGSSKLHPIYLNHTSGCVNCPVCAKVNAQLSQALTAELTFSFAFEIWINRRRLKAGTVAINASYISPKTERDYVVCARALSKFFGSMQLGQIRAAHLMEYQHARAICDRSIAEWAKPAGANCIRKEIALLIRILKAARLWSEDDRLDFQPLRAAESDEVRAITSEQQHRLLHVASMREEYQMIFWYTILALQTTCGTGEMRNMRLGDIQLESRIIQVQRLGAKNKYRQRTIPLVTDDAVWALGKLVGRARGLGCTQPSNYLFPFRVAPGSYDPKRPMSESGLKKIWDKVRIAADLPNLRIYDLRHTGITRMAESGVPLPMVMSFAGHMTQRTQQRYIAISVAAQRGWGEQVWGSGLRPDLSNDLPAVTPRRPVRSIGGYAQPISRMG